MAIKKVKSIIFCYSWSFLFASKQQSKLHENKKIALSGRHGGRRTVQDDVQDPVSISTLLAVPLGL